MASVIVCCRDLVAVVGWLAASLAGVAPQGRPALEAGRPAVMWHVPGEGRGTPAVRDETAFFLTKRHELLAVDVASGRIRWRRSTRGPGETTAGAMVVATPTVIVAGDGDLVAFSHDGVERWRFRPGDGSMVGAYLGEATETLVFAGSSAGTLWAVDATSGVPRWSVRVSGDGRTTVFAPIVAGPIVVAGFTSFGEIPRGGVVAIEAASGRVRWRRWLQPSAFASGRAFAGGPIVTDSAIVVARQDGAIYALDPRSGTFLWSIDPPAMSGPGGSYEYRALTRAGSSLVAASLRGLVTAYDLGTRRERWRRAPADASVAFGLASDGRTVYVPYLAGPLVALRVDDGEEQWRAAPSDFSWTPLVVAGRVLAASSSAGFFAFHQ